MARQKTSPAAIEKRQRMDQALKLRARGKVYREIAEEMGIGQTTAYEYVQDAMAEIPRESAEIVFNIDLDRLDKALEALWPAVLEGDVKAIEAMLKIHDKRVRLFHLDKVHGKGDETADSVIDQLARAVNLANDQNQDDDDGD